MAQKQEVALNFSSLTTLDEGRVNALLGLHIQRLAQDCVNRPACPDPRKATLEFELKPVCDESGHCEEVKVEITAKSKMPTYRTKTYHMRASSKGLFFNQDFPDSPDQLPLFGKDGEK